MMKPFVSEVFLITLSAGPTLEGEKKVPLPNIAGATAGWSFGILIDCALYIFGTGGENTTGKVRIPLKPRARE
jgi:hypothetical protein